LAFISSSRALSAAAASSFAFLCAIAAWAAADTGFGFSSFSDAFFLGFFLFFLSCSGRKVEIMYGMVN